MLASHRVLLVMTLTATDRASDSKVRREKNKKWNALTFCRKFCKTFRQRACACVHVCVCVYVCARARAFTH